MRFVGPVERALYLMTLPQLEGLPSRTIAALAELGRERSFNQGAVVLSPGEPPPSFHIVVEGEISVVGAEETRPVLVGPRQNAGLLALLARFEAGVEAVAAQDTQTLELGREPFTDLLQDDLDLFLGLVRWLARRTLEERREIVPGAVFAPASDSVPDHPQALDLAERVNRVRRPGSPFERASLEGIIDLSRRSEITVIPAGTTLWSSGDRAREAYLIITGTVHCTTQWTLVPFRCGPGYPLGNIERLCDEPRWYTAVAETEIVAIRSDTDTFIDVVEDHADMALDFVAAMAGNLIRILREKASAEGAARG